MAIYPFLSVFTEPAPKRPKRLLRIRNAILKLIRYYLKGIIVQNAQKYGGHYAVTRSLMDGLEKVGAIYNYNTVDSESIFENVILLSGIERIKEILCLKKCGKIKLLLVGPNIVDNVLDYDGIVADPLVDYFLVPSEWVEKVVITDCPKLKNRVMIWPSGVDSTFWSPKISVKKRRKVLLYKKTEDRNFHQEVLDLIKILDFEVEEVIYGNYDIAHFRKKLNQSKLAIFISRSESQGIALIEAWSMDVPTLVFNPGNFMYGGRNINGISACPFLTEAVGREWKTLAELENLLQMIKNGKFVFSPRNFVLNRFTDEICAKDLLNKIKYVEKANNDYVL